MSTFSVPEPPACRQTGPEATSLPANLDFATESFKMIAFFWMGRNDQARLAPDRVADWLGLISSVVFEPY